jgi:acyl-CoA:acyl-CoA alkyltransferase
MKWSRVCVEAIAVELPEERVTSAALESRLAPLYDRYHLGLGQLEALTGVRERRFWPEGPCLAEHAAKAGRKALDEAGVAPEDIGAVIYGGVCRDDLEPATACGVADRLNIRGSALVMDVANACLGVLTGMTLVANMIELGQIKAGLVVSAESAREIAGDTVERMLRENSLDTWRRCLASLTGGSGAVAVVLTEADFSFTGRSLLGGAALSAPEHHKIARWGPREGILGQTSWVMETDAPAVLEHGVKLGRRTFDVFLSELGWRASDVERAICHQVGKGHQETILATLGIPPEREYATYPTLGNMGTVALPATTAFAAQDGFIAPGDRVGLLGIGTGLNCLMLGVQW